MLKKTLRIIHSVISDFFIIGAVVLLVMYIIKIRPYAVITGSMSPTIDVGSIVFVDQRISISDIDAGDIIAFKVGDNTLVTHRAVEIRENEITTRGDANNTEDAAKVTKDNFVGKTIFWIPKVGRAIVFLRTAPGIVIFVTIAVAFVLSGHFLNEKPTSKGAEDE